MKAEEAAKEDKPKRPLTPAELRAKAKEEEEDGLCNPVSLEIFTTWYSMGGTQHGISPMEIMAMPAWLRQDFSTIMNYLSEERDRVKRSKPPKPKPRKR